MVTTGNKMPFSQSRETQKPMPIQTLCKPESRYLARGFVVYRISATVIMLHLSNEAIWCTYKDHYDVHTFYEGAPIILQE